MYIYITAYFPFLELIFVRSFTYIRKSKFCLIRVYIMHQV